MVVDAEGWFAGVQYNNIPRIGDLSSDLGIYLAENMALNGTAFLVHQGDLPVKFVGNITDCALLVLLEREWGKSYKQVRAMSLCLTLPLKKGLLVASASQCLTYPCWLPADAGDRREQHRRSVPVLKCQEDGQRSAAQGGQVRSRFGR